MPRHDYTQRLARLTKILTLLYHPKSDGSLCAKSLAQEFGVSLRTLRRDVEMMGADFSYERDTIYFLGSKLPNSTSQADSFIALALLRSFAYSMNGEIKSQMLSLLNSLESTSARNAEPFFTRSNLEEIALEPESIAPNALPPKLPRIHQRAQCRAVFHPLKFRGDSPRARVYRTLAKSH